MSQSVNKQVLSLLKMAEEIKSFLASLKLEQYSENFLHNGYDDPSCLKNIDDGDLNAMGITLAGHRKRILQNGWEGCEYGGGAFFFFFFFFFFLFFFFFFSCFPPLSFPTSQFFSLNMNCWREDEI